MVIQCRKCGKLIDGIGLCDICRIIIRNRRLSKIRWSILLFGIVIYDTINTLLMVHCGVAVEYNPLLRGLVVHNPFALVLVKLIPVILLVRYGKTWHIALAFWLYLIIYLTGTLVLNLH